MKKLALISVFSGILLLTACGSNNGGTPSGGGQGNFTKSSLKGQYTYQIEGYDLNNNGAPYREAGYFVADGNGNLTSGSDDFAEAGGSGVQNTSTTGSYSVNADGTGSLTMNNLNGGITFSLTLVSTSEFYMNEADTSLIANGHAFLQTSSSLAAVPTGKFIFRLHSCVACFGSDSVSLVGSMTVTTTALTGFDDVMRGFTFDNGSTDAMPITGSLNTPSAAGRGTGTINDPTGTVTFIYYIVDSKHLRFMVSDGSSIGLGSAETQTGVPTNASLKGNYVFGTRADDANSGLQGQNTAGVFTAGGKGVISTGTADSVQDGNSFTQVGLNGSYSVASTGRVAVTLNGGLGTVQQVFWLANYGRGYILTNSTVKVEDGTMDIQQAITFSNATLTGQQAFSMNGIEFTTSGGVIALTRVGWIIWNAQGSLTWNEALNSSSSGFSTTGNLAGTYAVSSNGRVGATVNSLSITNNDVVLYMVTPTQAYMLQNTTGVQIVGSMKGQTSQ
ncbi:MAG TPA: hypothetical protein VF753_05080 [Terriglobales bacterium]